MMEVLLMSLCLLLTTPAGVQPKEFSAKAGEMVHLQCPQNRQDGAELIWTSHTKHGMNLTIHTSPAERRQMGVLLHGRSFVILNASVNHQGNYSCSLRNASRPYWFRLTVHAETREDDNRSTYPMTCYTEEACTMECPSPNIPMKALNITTQDVIWHKEGESAPKPNYFSRVQETDQGVYTCTRSYLYDGHLYNMTFISELSVKPSNKVVKSARINSPRMGEIFVVDLGSTMVIDCKAVIYSDFDEVFWLKGDSFVEKDSNLPVFYNYTRKRDGEDIRMTVSLIFRKVSEDDLLQNYTCKLDTDGQPSSSVTIILAQKFRPSCTSLVVSTVCIVVVMGLAVVIYIKFKIDISLFLRDTLGCYRSSSDGKTYDVFLMFYKSSTDPGLDEDERTWLKSILEDKYGYRLCLYDRDVLPGKSMSEAVLDCIEQSHTVALVPTFPDPGLGSGLLSAIHEALVERQTGLVFIKTEAAEASRSGSMPEALQLLCKAGNCVTWKGIHSIPPSCSFWKQLRYYLPAPQMTPKARLLP